MDIIEPIKPIPSDPRKGKACHVQNKEYSSESVHIDSEHSFLFSRSFISRAAVCNKIVTEENTFRGVGRISISVNPYCYVEDATNQHKSNIVEATPEMVFDSPFPG